MWSHECSHVRMTCEDKENPLLFVCTFTQGHPCLPKDVPNTHVSLSQISQVNWPFDRGKKETEDLEEQIRMLAQNDVTEIRMILVRSTQSCFGPSGTWIMLQSTYDGFRVPDSAFSDNYQIF